MVLEGQCQEKTYIMMEKMEQDPNNMYVERRFGKLPQVNPGAMDLPMAIDLLVATNMKL